MAKSALCRSNLRQLWEVFHDSARSGTMATPSAAGWVSFVDDRGCMKLMKCPEDTDEPSLAGGLEGLYIDHSHCDGQHYFVYLIEALAPGAPLGQGVLHQVSVVHVSETVKEVRIFGGASIRIHLGSPIVIEGLYDNLNTIGGSDHHLKRDETLLMELGGMTNHEGPKPPKIVLGGSDVSYGMNDLVKTLAPRPGQLLLLDYEKSIASPLEDFVSGEEKYLAPRHLGKVNAVFADGGVRSLWPESVDAEGRVWEP